MLAVSEVLILQLVKGVQLSNENTVFLGRPEVGLSPLDSAGEKL